MRGMSGQEATKGSAMPSEEIYVEKVLTHVHWCLVKVQTRIHVWSAGHSWWTCGLFISDWLNVLTAVMSCGVLGFILDYDIDRSFADLIYTHIYIYIHMFKCQMHQHEWQMWSFHVVCWGCGSSKRRWWRGQDLGKTAMNKWYLPDNS